MSVSFTEAPDVEREIQLLVDSGLHPELVDVPISAVFRSKSKSNKGRTVLATASLVTGKTAWLARARWDGADFYLIEVAEDEWELLGPDARRALVDHELTHCAGPDPEKGRLALRGHDLEEFICIVERHGAWKDDIKWFARACQQLELPPEMATT